MAPVLAAIRAAAGTRQSTGTLDDTVASLRASSKARRAGKPKTPLVDRRFKGRNREARSAQVALASDGEPSESLIEPEPPADHPLQLVASSMKSAATAVDRIGASMKDTAMDITGVVADSNKLVRKLGELAELLAASKSAVVEPPPSQAPA